MSNMTKGEEWALLGIVACAIELVMLGTGLGVFAAGGPNYAPIILALYLPAAAAGTLLWPPAKKSIQRLLTLLLRKAMESPLIRGGP